MFRHVVMFWWKPEANQDEVDEAARGLASLPAKIAEIQRYEHGPDIGAGGDNADYVLVADFRNIEEWRLYALHPDHINVVESSIRPIADRIERIQYEVS